jgi:hypothetical protein
VRGNSWAAMAQAFSMLAPLARYAATPVAWNVWQQDVGGAGMVLLMFVKHHYSCGRCSLRIAVVIAFVIVVVLFILFLVLFFLVRLFSNEDIGSYRAIRQVFRAYSAHAQSYAS